MRNWHRGVVSMVLVLIALNLIIVPVYVPGYMDMYYRLDPAAIRYEFVFTTLYSIEFQRIVLQTIAILILGAVGFVAEPFLVPFFLAIGKKLSAKKGRLDRLPREARLPRRDESDNHAREPESHVYDARKEPPPRRKQE